MPDSETLTGSDTRSLAARWRLRLHQKRIMPRRRRLRRRATTTRAIVRGDILPGTWGKKEMMVARMKRKS